jgi:hypothetical protein
MPARPPTASTPAPAPLRWIPVSESLPDLELPCWLWDGQCCWIGARCPDPEGWLWGNAYGTLWWSKGRWHCECEADDDYRPLCWLPLPHPPEEIKAETLKR